jgi:dihydrodipicolinate synthase/N-acetylneuraminate lyase
MIGYFGGLPRRPMLPATDAEKAEIRKALDTLGLVP